MSHVAREGIKMFVEQVDFLELKGMCENPIEANDILQREQIDLLFLDIQMPKLTGLDFLKMLKDPPMVIIITAYPNFALEGYEMDVLDYLVKPVALERFIKAANKANDYYRLLSSKLLLVRKIRTISLSNAIINTKKSFLMNSFMWKECRIM